MKFLLDTNVYFSLLADPAFLPRHRVLFAQIAPRTFLSSIVLAELLQGARGDLGRARVRRAVATLERTGRVIAPLHADWVRAATIQGEIWDRHPRLRTKSLLHDALLACSARRIGAIVVTANERDFALIRTRLAHTSATLDALAVTPVL